MSVFRLLRRRRWRSAVNREFRKEYGVDLRTVGEVIGPATLYYLLNDEYELEPDNTAAGAGNVAQMLTHVYRVNIASLGTRDVARTIPGFEDLQSVSPRSHGPAVEHDKLPA